MSKHSTTYQSCKNWWNTLQLEPRKCWYKSEPRQEFRRLRFCYIVGSTAVTAIEEGLKCIMGCLYSTITRRIGCCFSGSQPGKGFLPNAPSGCRHEGESGVATKDPRETPMWPHWSRSVNWSLLFLGSLGLGLRAKLPTAHYQLHTNGQMSPDRHLPHIAFSPSAGPNLAILFFPPASSSAYRKQEKPRGQHCLSSFSNTLK